MSIDFKGTINYHMDNRKHYLKRLQDKTNRMMRFMARGHDIELQNVGKKRPIYNLRAGPSSEVTTRMDFTSSRKKIYKKKRSHWQRKPALPSHSIIEEEDEEYEDQVVPQLYEPGMNQESESEQVVPLVASAGDRDPDENLTIPLQNNHANDAEKKKEKGEEPREEAQTIDMPEDLQASNDYVPGRNEIWTLCLLLCVFLFLLCLTIVAIENEETYWTFILFALLICFSCFGALLRVKKVSPFTSSPYYYPTVGLF